jgi:RNA polymerase sigma-70 factor (ECF subfamily)
MSTASADVNARVPADIAVLFDVHGAFLLRVLVRIVGDRTQAEDVLQEVFLLAHRRRHELDPNGNVVGWLYRSALNVVRHHRRTLARRARLHAAVAREPRGDDGRGPERPGTMRDTAQNVRACLTALPISQREVFVLFELEELDGERIAELVGAPVATVWTRLHRGRDKFRRAWRALEDRS